MYPLGKCPVAPSDSSLNLALLCCPAHARMKMAEDNSQASEIYPASCVQNSETDSSDASLSLLVCPRHHGIIPPCPSYRRNLTVPTLPMRLGFIVTMWQLCRYVPDPIPLHHCLLLMFVVDATRCWSPSKPNRE
jgi:hypothetical protein